MATQERMITVVELTLMKERSDALLHALQAIAGMVINEETDHAELSALCIALARIALDRAPRAMQTPPS